MKTDDRRDEDRGDLDDKMKELAPDEAAAIDKSEEEASTKDS